MVTTRRLSIFDEAPDIEPHGRIGNDRYVEINMNMFISTHEAIMVITGEQKIRLFLVFFFLCEWVFVAKEEEIKKGVFDSHAIAHI